MKIFRVRNPGTLIYLTLFTIGSYIVYRVTEPEDVEMSNSNFIPKHGNKARNKCLKKVAKFSSKPLTKIALATYPGSGNTWLRHLIQQATGIATGSVYCDPTLQDYFIGECVYDDTVLGIKTHEWFDKNLYKKAVILMRSPFKSFGSHFHGEQTGDHVGVVSKEYFDKHFPGFLKTMLPNWRWFNEEWMRDFVGPKHIMLYDNLKSDLKGEMRKLLTFLDVKYNETDFQCMLINHEGSAHRLYSTKVNITQYFSPEQTAKTEEDIKHIEKMAFELTGVDHKIARQV